MKPVSGVTCIVSFFAGVLAASSHVAESKTAAANQVTSRANQIREPLESKLLDLRPPNITNLLRFSRVARAPFVEPPEEIRVIAQAELLPQTDSESPTPWSGVSAPVWALLHPTGAWWIFAPISTGNVKELSLPPNLAYEIFRPVLK